MLKENKIVLAEPLQIVLQGEGKNCSKKMILVRTLGCPLQCPSCDSKQTWKKIKKPCEYTVSNLARELTRLSEKYEINHVLLTGGEPAIWMDSLVDLFQIMSYDRLWSWDIETSGIKRFDRLRPFWDRIQFNVSPKIGSLQPGKSVNYDFLKGDIPRNTIIKIVTSKKTWEEDKVDIALHLHLYPNIKKSDIYLMPMGYTKWKVRRESKFLIEKAKQLHFNFSPRLHVLIYGKKKLV